MAMPVQGILGKIAGVVGRSVVVSSQVCGNAHGNGPGARERREGRESQGAPKRGSNHRASMSNTCK